MYIIEPGGDWYRMGWVEDITGGRIVYDDSILQIPAQLVQVFYIVSHMIVTRLPEKPMVHDFVYIKDVENWISVLCQRSREDDNLEDFAHLTHKLIDSRSFDDIYIVEDAIDLYRNDEISLMYELDR